MNSAALHDEADLAQGGDVLQRVRRGGDGIGDFPPFEIWAFSSHMSNAFKNETRLVSREWKESVPRDFNERCGEPRVAVRGRGWYGLPASFASAAALRGDTG